MIKKFLKTFLFLFMVMLFWNCERNETEEPTILQNDIEFYTDKSIYGNDEKIAICFRNNTALGLHVNWCRLFYKERFENGTWENMGGPPCPGESYYIYIAPNQIKRDTINCTWLDKGKYRLVTYYLQMDTVYFFMYSNEFEITD